LVGLFSGAAFANAAEADRGARIQLRGIDVPPEGKFGRLGFEIRARWMNGFFQMRYPETLRTSIGLHFIDHDRRDMPPLSMLAPFPRWELDEGTGEVSYWHKTPEGVEFGGSARPYEDEIHLEYRVKNGTDSRLNQASPQMCLTLTDSPDFDEKLDLTDTPRARRPSGSAGSTSCTTIPTLCSPASSATPRAGRNRRQPSCSPTSPGATSSPRPLAFWEVRQWPHEPPTT